jgi:hypothetical protein
MSWNYSGDPSDSALDEVRFYVQDTDRDDPLISDEEIEFLIARWSPIYGSNIMVASMVAEAIAAKFAREISYSADGVSVGVNELQTKYDALAASLRDQYKMFDIGSDADYASIMYSDRRDYTIKPTIWAIGMNDNTLAGQQDYGALPAAPLYYETGGEEGVP